VSEADILDEWQERAAIMQFDGEAPRFVAERRARQRMIEKYGEKAGKSSREYGRRKEG
jgi:hypothetical protein